MANTINISLAIACLAYAIVSAFATRAKLLRDPFHPRAVLRVLIPYALVISLFTAENEALSTDTKSVILLTALFFLVSIDVVDALLIRRSKGRVVFGEGRHDIFFARAFLLLFFAGWVWRAFAVTSGLWHGTLLATQLEISNFGNAFGQLNGVGFLALLGWMIFSRTRTFSRTILVMTGAEVIWAFLSGSKIAIFYVLIPILLIAHRRQWFRFRLSFVVAGMALGIATVNVMFSVVTEYRISVHQAVADGRGLDLRTFVDGFGKAAVNVFSPSQRSQVTPAATALADRLNWAGFFGSLIERRDLWRNAWLGESYLPILTWWVPRSIWSDKPPVSIGGWYGAEVLGWAYNTRSEGAITIWGDGLLNFGLIGPALASLIWIYFSFFVYERVGARSKWGLLIVAAVYMRLIIGAEQNMAAPIVAVQMQILAVACVWVLFQVSRHLFWRKY